MWKTKIKSKYYITVMTFHLSLPMIKMKIVKFDITKLKRLDFFIKNKKIKSTY